MNKILILFFLVVSVIMVNPIWADTSDPYLWLEEVESSQALNWVKLRNERSLSQLKKHPIYDQLENDIRQIHLAKDRIPTINYRDGFLYNFWQDKKNVRGLWRRTTLEEYKKESPAWETILDLDQLSANEDKNWVWKGANCLPTKSDYCLLSLSNGGKDAVVVREFNVLKKEFVKNGFLIPEAKSDVSWLDENTILIGTDFGEGSLTDSGYPRIVKKWLRGTPLSQAVQVFEGTSKDVSAGAFTSFRPEGKKVFFTRALTFFEQENWVLGENNQLEKIPFPSSADFKGNIGTLFFALLREPLEVRNHTYSAGSLISLEQGKALESVQLVYAPKTRTSIEGVSFHRDSIYLSLLDNVRGRLLRLKQENSNWTVENISYPENGTISIWVLNPLHDVMITGYQDYITPETLFLQRATNPNQMKVLKRSPTRFDSSHLEIKQKESISKDGTHIPYFMIHKKGMPLDGSNPTLLYGYGGFEVSEVPYYLSSWGKVWLEKGGVIAIGNIRGGGEFGPEWHRAAILENRQKSFDDFISVAENLIQTRVTSSRRLAIMGGSNGGLLVGAVFVQRPELFRAVVDQVPLLDMMRYHKLLAGASWMAEYGNPDDPKMAEAILKYSPYQNLKKDKIYPKVFFVTSTKDDRVHPGHARKMAARMEEYGYKFDYFENIDGGHGGSANLEEAIQMESLEFTFLYRELFE